MAPRPASLSRHGPRRRASRSPTMAPMSPTARPSPALRSSSSPRPCSGRSGRCRGSPTTRGCSRRRSSRGAARSACSRAAAFVAWRISRGTERLTRLGDLDTAAPVSLGRRGAVGFTLNLVDVHRVRPRHGRARAARVLHLPGDRRGRQRGPRARDARPAAGRRARARRRWDGRGRRRAARPGGRDPARRHRARAGARRGRVSQAVFVVISRTATGGAGRRRRWPSSWPRPSCAARSSASRRRRGGAWRTRCATRRSCRCSLFTGLFAAAIPSILFLTGIRLIGGTRAGILMLFEPVVGVALAAVAARRAPGPDPGRSAAWPSSARRSSCSARRRPVADGRGSASRPTRPTAPTVERRTTGRRTRPAEPRDRPVPAAVRRPRIRVLIVDDHAMVRRGMRDFLDLHADLEVVGEASDGETALAETERLRPTWSSWIC